MDRGLEQTDATDFVSVNGVVAEPWRQYFAVSPVEVGESEDLLSDDESDLVRGYTDRRFHDCVSQREGKGQHKGWWKVDAIVSGSYNKNAFVRRVLDQLSNQDEPIGGKPPSYLDLLRSQA